MARKKGVNLSQEDILFAVGGALGGIVINGALNKALASQPESTRDMVGKALPAIKLLGGGYVAMNKKMDRKLRFAAIGMAATGGIELGTKFAPDYFSIGNSADVFEMIGRSDDVLALPIVPSVPLEEPAFMAADPVLGTYSDMGYESDIDLL